jgi:hypothetical protein
MARRMIGAFQATRTRAVQADRFRCSTKPDHDRLVHGEGRYQAKGEPRVGGEARFFTRQSMVFATSIYSGPLDHSFWQATSWGASLRNHSVAVNQVIEAIASDVDRAVL